VFCPVILFSVALAPVHNYKQGNSDQKEAVGNNKVIYYMHHRQNAFTYQSGNQCQQDTDYANAARDPSYQVKCFHDLVFS
jgi:hypothetical protein